MIRSSLSIREFMEAHSHAAPNRLAGNANQRKSILGRLKPPKTNCQSSRMTNSAAASTMTRPDSISHFGKAQPSGMDESPY